MLQPELIEVLGSGTPRILAEEIVKNRECVALQQKGTEDEREHVMSPFTFRPERIRVATEDECFEVMLA